MPSAKRPRAVRRSTTFPSTAFPSTANPASLPPTSAGVHLLCCPAVIDRLIRAAALDPDDLVIDFGAGPGGLTAPLARTGARVLAVERDDRFAHTLRRRFTDRPSVRVVHGDLRAIPLPRREFAVVASIPFAVSTPLLRRLLTPVRGRLGRAEVVLEWGLARRLTAARPRDLELAWWAARFDLRLTRRIPARCFTPAPAVDAAHLSVRRRPGLDARAQAMLWRLLTEVYRRPAEPARRVLGELVSHRRAGRLLHGCATDPASPAGQVPVPRWTALATALAADRSLVPPPLPRSRYD